MKKLVVMAGMVVTMFSVALLGGCGSTPASTGDSTQTQIETTVAENTTQAAEAVATTETESAEKAAAVTEAAPAATSESADKASAQGITEEKAMDIALSDAGVANADATRKEIHLDYDDDYGKEVFDIEFHKGTTEYSYDIDPANGNILNSEMDIDD